MNRTSIPFNITLLKLTQELMTGLRPVKVLDIFEGGSSDFHPEGLFSTEIFGKVGDERRNYRYSYIDIKIEVLHPVIFKALSDMKRLYGEIMSGETYAVWDEEDKDFIKSDPLNGGQTGMYFFLSKWKQIDFKETKSITREEKVKLIKKYYDNALNRYIVVLPAGLRDLEINRHNRITENEINTIYRRMLKISNTIIDSTVKSAPEVLDTPRYQLQLAFNDLYETLEAQVKGKKKLMLNRWASRRIFNGTRNVITAMDTSVEYLGDPNNVDFNTTIIGLYQYLKATLPVSIYQIRKFLNGIFTDINQPAKLVNKTTLKSEAVLLHSKYYDLWGTNEGIEKIITSMKEESIRDKYVEINGYYLALIYKGPDGTYKIINDIDEVPQGRSKKDVRPITMSEFLYHCVYKDSKKYPLFVTRYPITGVGSIYPSKTHLKVTIKSERRIPLDSDWKPIEESIAVEFPIVGQPYVNSLVPHSSRLQGLGAD